MGKSISGLRLRGKVWWIDKKINRQRIQESTGTSDRAEAERYLIYKLEQLRQAKVYGVRPKRTFAEAAVKYVREKKKRSIADDIGHIDTLMPYIGELHLEAIHMGTLAKYIAERQNGKFAKLVEAEQTGLTRCKKVVTNQTINAALKVVRHILKLAAGKWRDESGLTWLTAVPMFEFLDEKEEKRKAIPLSWKEQDKLFAELSPELRHMALFAVNTGCRNEEICQLRWEWEIPIPALDTSVFVIPRQEHKNKCDRLVVLNDIAKGVVEEVRGINPAYVFTYKRKPYYNMMSTSWRKGRKRAGLPGVRVHDLKHTFGTRLRNAGVSREDRKDLLGHIAAEDITTHYSVAGISKLIELANRVCIRNEDISVASFLKQLNDNAKNIVPFTSSSAVVKKTNLSTVVSSKAFVESYNSPTVE